MAYPVLAPNSTWFAPNVSTIATTMITEVEVVDSYSPDTSVTVADSWDASAAKDGSITCYAIGTKLIIAGNGSGKIAANEDSSLMFRSFKITTSITGLDTLDVSNVTNMYGMFGMCYALTTLDGISNWNTSKVTRIDFLFYGDENLSSIDVSNWDVSAVQDMTNTFRHCMKLSEIDISNWNTSSTTNMYCMFYQCISLSELDVSNWDVSNVTDFEAIFRDCQSLSRLTGIEKWDVSKATKLTNMFGGCSKLTDLDVSNFNVSSCTDMGFMFYGTSSLGEIDVSNWDVSKVTTIDHFAAHAGLRRKGIENWKTTSLVNANAAFHNCAEEELDLSGWDVSKVQIFGQMFENSPNLKRIKGLEKWNTSSGLGFEEMFERCYKLEEVDISSFDTSKAKNGVEGSPNGHLTATLNNMFYSCNNLKKVTLGPNFSINGDGTNTTAANKLILPTPSTDYIEGADGMWYTFNGESYAPDAVKDRTAETYYASYDIVADMDVICKNGNLIDTAKAIREIAQNDSKFLPSEFGDTIRDLGVSIVVDEDNNASLVNAILSVNENGEGTLGV